MKIFETVSLFSLYFTQVNFTTYDNFLRSFDIPVKDTRYLSFKVYVLENAIYRNDNNPDQLLLVVFSIHVYKSKENLKWYVEL